MMLAVNPFVGGPIIDDWTYAWSVENLLNTGKLRILDWSSHYPIFQILWGTIFSLPFGFSFGALRLSTIALAWIGTLAFYRTLRELDFDKMSSLLGVLLLALNPVYFVLTYSFMTDVPFISMMNLAILSYVLAIKRRSCVFIWLGGILSLASFLIRQLGITIPLAFLIYFVLNRATFTSGKGVKGFTLHSTAAVLFPFIGFVLLFLWIKTSFGITSIYSHKVSKLSYFFAVPAWKYFGYLLRMGLHLSLILSPLALSWLLIPPLPPFKKGGWGGFLVSLTLVLFLDLMYFFIFQEFPLAISKKGDILSLPGLGAARPLISGEIQGCFFPCFWFKSATILISQISLTIMFLALFQAIKGFMQYKHLPKVLIYSNGLFQFGLINLLWLYYDRYYLVLFPCLIPLVLEFLIPPNPPLAKGGVRGDFAPLIKRCQRGIFSRGISPQGKRVIMAGLVIFALVSIMGTRDNLSFAKATWEGISWLKHRGVPVHEIDGGYALNGWFLYAHPENLPSGAIPQKDIPWVNTKKKLPYVISNSILPGYKVIKRISWKSSPWMMASIYVLQEEKNSANH